MATCNLIYLLFVEIARNTGTGNHNLLEFIDWPYLFTKFYALPPNRRVDIPREINEAEKMDWIWNAGEQ